MTDGRTPYNPQNPRMAGYDDALGVIVYWMPPKFLDPDVYDPYLLVHEANPLNIALHKKAGADEIRALIDAGADVHALSGSALGLAICGKDPAIVRIILDAMDGRVVMRGYAGDFFGVTALGLASQQTPEIFSAVLDACLAGTPDLAQRLDAGYVENMVRMCIKRDDPESVDRLLRDKIAPAHVYDLVNDNVYLTTALQSGAVKCIDTAVERIADTMDMARITHYLVQRHSQLTTSNPKALGYLLELDWSQVTTNEIESLLASCWSRRADTKNLAGLTALLHARGQPGITPKDVRTLAARTAQDENTFAMMTAMIDSLRTPMTCDEMKDVIFNAAKNIGSFVMSAMQSRESALYRAHFLDIASATTPGHGQDMMMLGLCTHARGQSDENTDALICAQIASGEIAHAVETARNAMERHALHLPPAVISLMHGLAARRGREAVQAVQKIVAAGADYDADARARACADMARDPSLKHAAILFMRGGGDEAIRLLGGCTAGAFLQPQTGDTDSESALIDGMSLADIVHARGDWGVVFDISHWGNPAQDAKMFLDAMPPHMQEDARAGYNAMLGVVNRAAARNLPRAPRMARPR